jgi:hypothetical protein
MPKSAVASRGLRKHEPPRLAELPNAVEGQITEICRDLADARSDAASIP